MPNILKSVADPTQFQIKAFIDLVAAVNKIPQMVIDLGKENDRQRDALAFVVDTIYRQFKSSNWPLALEELPVKVQGWNVSNNPREATSSLLQFIQSLFECRIAEMKKAPLTEKEREYIDTLRNLYQTSTQRVLADALREKKNAPVSLGGIPRDLLPDWYLNGQYRKDR